MVTGEMQDRPLLELDVMERRVKLLNHAPRFAQKARVHKQQAIHTAIGTKILYI